MNYYTYNQHRDRLPAFLDNYGTAKRYFTGRITPAFNFKKIQLPKIKHSIPLGKLATLAIVITLIFKFDMIAYLTAVMIGYLAITNYYKALQVKEEKVEELQERGYTEGVAKRMQNLVQFKN